MRVRVIGVVGVVVALVAGACGSDDSPDTAVPADTAATTTAAAGPLTASAPGVTEKTISLGAVGIDYDHLRELGLVDINRGDAEVVWQVFVDELNARGGIGGRQIELDWRPYSVIQAQEAEAVCIELTEDIGVFAVLNGFNGPAQSADDCVANQHETILISDVATHEQMLAGAAPWIQIGFPGNERFDRGLVDLADDHGVFDEATVSVHSLVASADRIPSVVDQLEELGVNVVLQTVNDAPTTDAAEGAAQWKVIAETMRQRDVDTIVVLGTAAFAYGQIIDNGLDVQVVTSDNTLGGLGSFGIHPPSAFDGAIGVFGRLSEESWEDDGFLDCIDTFESATGIEVIPSPEVPDGDPDWQVPVTVVCNRLALFEQLATIAGPQLTNDSFRAAIESDPDLDLPGTPFASYGPDKYDGNDALRLVEFDSTKGTEGGLAPLTELAPIE